MNLGFYLMLMIGPTTPAPVPQAVIEALSSVQVTSSARGRSGFQLAFTLGKRSPLNVSLLPGGYFDPPARVILSVVVNGLLTVLMDGVITQHQLSPSNEPGQATLTVTGEDLARLMDVKDLRGDKSYFQQTRDQRVLTLLQDYEQYGITPNVRPCPVHDTPDPKKTIPQHIGTALAYINTLASEVGYVFYLDPGPMPKQSTAYWGPEIKTGTPQPALSVNLDAQTNVESLNFTYDAFSKSSYTFDIQDEDTGKPSKQNLEDKDIFAINPLMGTKTLRTFRQEKVSVPDGCSPTTARQIAAAKVSQSADVITASGQLDVLRYGNVLKPRRLVGVRGAGVTYDGLYYVRSITHNIKVGEYKQSFELSRNALVSYTPTLLV
jgi:hypothetical protein